MVTVMRVMMNEVLVFGDVENGHESQFTVTNERHDVEDGREMQFVMMIEQYI